MTHEDFRTGDRKLPSDRAFGLTISAVLALVFVRGLHVVPLIIAAIPALLALVWPATLRPLNLVWNRIGLAMHRIMQPVIMALLFAVIFVPAGLIGRVLGKDPLGLRFDPDANSYWAERKENRVVVVESMREQF